MTIHLKRIMNRKHWWKIPIELNKLGKCRKSIKGFCVNHIDSNQRKWPMEMVRKLKSEIASRGLNDTLRSPTKFELIEAININNIIFTGTLTDGEIQ